MEASRLLSASRQVEGSPSARPREQVLQFHRLLADERVAGLPAVDGLEENDVFFYYHHEAVASVVHVVGLSDVPSNVDIHRLAGVYPVPCVVGLPVGADLARADWISNALESSGLVDNPVNSLILACSRFSLVARVQTKRTTSVGCSG